MMSMAFKASSVTCQGYSQPRCKGVLPRDRWWKIKVAAGYSSPGHWSTTISLDGLANAEFSDLENLRFGQDWSSYGDALDLLNLVAEHPDLSRLPQGPAQRL
jgi:hypothetical protein